ncbi:MAG: inorganic diphosphatase [Asticcacaulis sp.]|uniref:inorganic diphosphatase n=1 Tax=Asticcacaulis sp. TaxID=1872648 RepID=UPI003F7C90B2
MDRNPFRYLSPFDEDGRLQAVIDTPKGSRAKYKLESGDGLLRLSKLLPRGCVFPFNFGFIPGAQGEDGDALDILVLGDEPLWPGCVLSVRAIGAVRALQTETDGTRVRNDRLIGVVENDFNPAEFHDISQLHPSILEQIEGFFIHYNQAQGRRFEPDERVGAEAALSLVRSAVGPA